MNSLMLAAAATLTAGSAPSTAAPVANVPISYVQQHEARFFLHRADDAFAVGNSDAANRFLFLAAVKQVANGLGGSARFPLIRILNSVAAPTATKQDARHLLDYINRTGPNITPFYPAMGTVAGSAPTANGVRRTGY